MRKLVVLGMGVCLVLAFASCKSSESAYKKAYEKAKQQELAEPQVEAPVEVTPVVAAPVTTTKVADTSGHDEVFIGKSMAHTRPYSEKTAAEMDAEIRAIIDEAYEKCREILARYKTELTAVAEYLLEHETMDGDTFKTYFTQSGESRQ